MRQKDLSITNTGWAEGEFGIINFGDKRLSKRLLKIANSFSNSPERSINQACQDWHQSKAAYRFFQNDSISERKILDSHILKTVERSTSYSTILAIQDTSYISYKNHKKTQGLGVIAARLTSKSTNFKTHGLVMHTTFAVTTEGLPLGLLDQKINARPELDEALKALKKRSHNIALPIEEKESIRWITSLKSVTNHRELEHIKVVTVCDREVDIYDLFETAFTTQSPFLVRAGQDRTVNKKSTYSEKSGEKLWALMSRLPSQGQIQVSIPARDNKPTRGLLTKSPVCLILVIKPLLINLFRIKHSFIFPYQFFCNHLNINNFIFSIKFIISYQVYKLPSDWRPLDNFLAFR